MRERITDERLGELAGMLQRDAGEKYVEEREMGGSDLQDTAAALRELQAARAIINCHCPKCEGKCWVEHQCPAS